jgi:tripartite-type tricarboxylate transporter receptor subunit TctC
VVARLNKEVVAALNDPAVKKKLEDLNLDPHPGTPEQAAAMLQGDIKRWGDVITKARIEKQ